MWKRVVVSIGSLAVALGGTVAGTGSASAQPARTSCHAASCNHLNPYKTYCSSDGRAVYSAHNELGDVVHLYYSPSCRAVWAESWAPAGDTIRVQRAGDSSMYSQDYTDGSHAWTGMINDAGFTAHAMIDDRGVNVWGQTPDY
ncbi:DUF2690 domain-containing protein [Kitasatospora sp. NPDC096077]|uniref:DUF2690 domain-containing protein n=1 Tax=Kitasatospora sp. NPDC096077 TaxID=3155544 RepID=UPI00331FC664